MMQFPKTQLLKFAERVVGGATALSIRNDLIMPSSHARS